MAGQWSDRSDLPIWSSFQNIGPNKGVIDSKINIGMGENGSSGLPRQRPAKVKQLSLRRGRDWKNLGFGLA